MEVSPLTPSRQELLFEENATPKLPETAHQRCRELLSLMFLAVIGATPKISEEGKDERED
jgi:hypothetical protein